ncbi:MAG: DUF4369 domain-containing protein [Muribaculaceae bacterium]|nr:DUF4369 domain-containing protein [Muribaculaceae bacterium]
MGWKCRILVLAACAALWLTACDDRRPATRYAVQLEVDTVLEVDSVSLLVWEDEYGQLRDMGSAALNNGSATLEGVLDAPRAACLRLDGTPFYFVLEPCTMHIAVKPHQVVVTGGPENHRYLDFVKLQASLTAQRQQLWQRYVAMGADSTLTADKELEMARTDSLLADSLQRITLEAINARHPASRIIAERYLHTLDSLHLQQLR